MLFNALMSRPRICWDFVGLHGPSIEQYLDLCTAVWLGSRFLLQMNSNSVANFTVMDGL